MIPQSKFVSISSIGGKQFMNARSRAAAAPVVVIDAVTFRVASSRRSDDCHTVTFDSADAPALCSCTCAAGTKAAPCWAMARALDALTALGVNNIWIGRGPRTARHTDGQGDSFQDSEAGKPHGGELVLLGLAGAAAGAGAASSAP